MLIRTHFAIALFFILLFGYFDKVFLFAFLIATLLPDIDSRFSKIGRKKIFRPLQFFAGHRKIIHSFVFLFLISIPLFFISKNIFYGFIFGYGLHLTLDCFTVRGIKLFYPFEFKIKGFIRTGSFFETLIFYIFLFADVVLFIRYFANISF